MARRYSTSDRERRKPTGQGSIIPTYKHPENLIRKPTPVDPFAIQALLDKYREGKDNWGYLNKDKEKKGRRATILTSGKGDTSQVNIYRRTLLG